MKKIACFLLLLIFLIPISVSLSACKNKQDPLENLNNYIAEISNYRSLGVGVLSHNQPTVASLSSIDYVSAAENSKVVLAGVTDEGNLEKVKFKKGNETKEPNLNVSSFNQTSRYIIITYTSSDVYTVNDLTFSNNETNKTYFIDKTTNLTYEFTLDVDFSLGNSTYGINGTDCNDSIIICADQSYYKVGVVGSDLEIREIFKTNTLPGHSSVILTDCYGNCIIKRFDNSTNYYYVLTNSGELVLQTLDISTEFDQTTKTATTYKSLDGKIYHDGQVLTTSGVFENSNSTPECYILQSENLIHSDENADYYYSETSFDSYHPYFWYYGHNVIKVNKTQNTYSFEKIELNIPSETHPDKLIISNLSIYSINTDNTIVKTNLLNGESKEIQFENNIILKTLELFNHNMIKFNATDLNLNNITGSVDINDNVSYTIDTPNFVCFYLSPIKIN